MSSTFAPTGEWIQVVPKGEWPHESGITQVVDALSLAAMKRNFDEAGIPLLIDRDHFSGMTDHSSAALGWGDRLEVREDGLWALPRWTAEGERALAGGEYRYLSPTFPSSAMERLDGKRARPLVLESVALTNSPNMRGAPLWNSRRRPAPSAAVAASAPPPPHWATLPPSCPVEAAIHFQSLCNRRRLATGQGFEAAWNATAREFPALYQRAHEAATNPREAIRAFRNRINLTAELLALRNRAGDTVQVSMSDLEWMEEEVKAAMEQEEQEKKDFPSMREHLVPFHHTPGLINSIFLGQVHGAQTRLGLSFDQAWQFVKDTFPLLWAYQMYYRAHPAQ